MQKFINADIQKCQTKTQTETEAQSSTWQPGKQEKQEKQETPLNYNEKTGKTQKPCKEQ